MAIPFILWNVLFTWLIIADPHPHLDKHHCYIDQAAFVQYCMPKDKCWFSSADTVTCWRVAKVGKK